MALDGAADDQKYGRIGGKANCESQLFRKHCFLYFIRNPNPMPRGHMTTARARAYRSYIS